MFRNLHYQLMFFNAPRAFICRLHKYVLRASSFPYFSSNNLRKIRNASAGSVVVPDLEITFNREVFTF